jgi:hypothetical protein
MNRPKERKGSVRMKAKRVDRQDWKLMLSVKEKIEKERMKKKERKN